MINICWIGNLEEGVVEKVDFMKRIYKVLIVFVISLLGAFLFYAYDIKSSESKVIRYVSDIIEPVLGAESGIENTEFCRMVKYEYLSNEYHNKISEEEYEKINTIEEAAELFNSIDIDININSFNGHRYIDTSKFKTPIASKLQIDKDKYAIVFYNVIVGMQGQKPIIKRINIEIQGI